MKFALSLVLIILTAGAAGADDPDSYSIEKITPHLYAAIAVPASTATSNAFFYLGDDQVIAGGAHMTADATRDLVSAIRRISDKPLRYFILPHHHPGYTSVDFYLPKETDVIMTFPVWQSLGKEVLPFPNETLLFSDGLTLKTGGRSLVLTNMGQGHSQGDLLVYFPEEKVLFTSDLVYVDSVGYMGEGHMEDWVLALEFMGQLDARKVIPGHGPVSGPEVITAYKDFLQGFLSEIIRHIEAGDSLEKTRKEFSMPRYRQMSGYDQMLELNVERAYRDLKDTVFLR